MQPSQGQGGQWFRNNPVGNFWHFKETALRPGQYIDATKLRGKTYGTRTAIHRANRALDTICHRCRLKPETLGHIVWECSAGQRARIERHNWIVGKIEDDAKRRGLTVAREQTFHLGDQRLKPDLVIKTREGTIVVDVTVPYENGDSRSLAAMRKVETYTPLLPVAQRHFGTTSGEVIPVVIGARGALPQASVTGLMRLGMAERKILVDFTLRTTIDICRGNLDYG